MKEKKEVSIQVCTQLKCKINTKIGMYFAQKFRKFAQAQGNRRKLEIGHKGRLIFPSHILCVRFN